MQAAPDQAIIQASISLSANTTQLAANALAL
jgi:hypothetical protein